MVTLILGADLETMLDCIECCQVEHVFEVQNFFGLLCSNIYIWGIVVHNKPSEFVDTELWQIVVTPCVFCNFTGAQNHRSEMIILVCCVVCLSPGSHFFRVIASCEITSCEPSWHPHYLALCESTCFVFLLFLCLHTVLLLRCLVLLFKGWDQFLLWHRDRHAALAFPKRFGLF